MKSSSESEKIVGGLRKEVSDLEYVWDEPKFGANRYQRSNFIGTQRADEVATFSRNTGPRSHP